MFDIKEPVAHLHVCIANETDRRTYVRTYLRIQHCVSALWCRDKSTPTPIRDNNLWIGYTFAPTGAFRQSGAVSSSHFLHLRLPLATLHHKVTMWRSPISIEFIHLVLNLNITAQPIMDIHIYTNMCDAHICGVWLLVKTTIILAGKAFQPEEVGTPIFN